MTSGEESANGAAAGSRGPAEHRIGPIDLAEGEKVIVDVEDREVAIFRIKGALKAWENRCPHQGGPVCTGRVLGRTEVVLAEDQTVLREVRSEEEIHLVCPWHGWEFNLETGVSAALSSRRLIGVEVIERDGEVLVRL